MQQINLKIKKQISKAGVLTVGNEKKFMNFIVWSFGVLMILYVLFLLNLISNIVQRRSLEANIRTLSNEVSNMELAYLNISNSLDVNFSQAMGFKEAKMNFVTRKSLGIHSNIKSIQNDI